MKKIFRLLPKFSDTGALSVGSIFQNNLSLTVPNYQRNYSWESNENSKNGCKICDLWNDLVEKYEDYMKDPTNVESGEYLLGPMVFVQNDNRTVEIVDGQQRLATLTILFCVARDIILELDPNTPYSDLGEIHKIIENAALSGHGLERTWQSWKLKLNQVDSYRFEKYIQRYKVEDPPIDDIIDQVGDKYYKNTKKVEFFNQEIKNNKNNYSDSEILLFEAYIELSERINNALILEFDSTLEVKLKLEEIKKDAEIEAEKKIKSDPKKFLGDNQEGFFNDINNGLTVFEKRTWPDEKKLKLMEELDKKNARNTAKGNPLQTFPDFIDGKIKTMKTKDFGGKGSYQTILDQETEKEFARKTEDQKRAHIPKLTGFCAGITEQINNVRIKVKEDEDAYQIFESLNDKGQSLSKSNLVKNLIMKIINDPTNKSTWSKKWDDMITSLNKEEMDVNKFLRMSLISRGFPDNSGKLRFGEFPIVNSSKKTKVTTNNFYRIVKAMITSESLAINYIENLQKDAEICIKFNSPQTKYPDTTTDLVNQNRDVKPALIDMAYLDAEYIIIPILCAYRKWKPTSDEFILLVKVLVSFFFRYKIVSKLSPSNLEQIAFVACDIISNGESGKEQKSLFKIIKFVLQYNKSAYFENQFEYRFDPPNDANVKFILKHVESYMKKKTDDTIPIDKVEIEHILPKGAKENDPDPNKVWDKTKFFASYSPSPGALPKDFTRWYKKLGNLTILNSVTNKKISNYNFPTKLDHKDNNGTYDGYRSSNMRINVETVCKDQETNQDRTEWTVNDIINRGIYFKNLAKEIWELPKIVCADTACSGHDDDHDITGTTISDLDTKKCHICNGDLTVRWPATAGPEYLAPTEYQN